MESQKSIDEMSFEQALSELDQIVRTLESGSAPLEDSITAYERGSALKKRCEVALSDAKARIETIALDENEIPKTQPFEESK